MNDIFDGSNINFLVAFLAGFITFFASCLLPLVPTYLTYLSGVALNEDRDQQHQWQIFKTGAMFVLGFVLTFIALGLAASQFAIVTNPYRKTIEKIASVLFILLGLFTLGVFKSKTLSKEFKFDLHDKFLQHRSLHAILTGIAFGFGWTPCIGPVLAVILFWAARADSALKGALLLTSYGIGLGVPFLVIALGFEKIIPLIKKSRRITQVTSIISGVFLILAGLLLLTDQFHEIAIYIMQLFNLSTFSA